MAPNPPEICLQKSNINCAGKGQGGRRTKTLGDELIKYSGGEALFQINEVPYFSRKKKSVTIVKLLEQLYASTNGSPIKLTKVKKIKDFKEQIELAGIITKSGLLEKYNIRKVEESYFSNISPQ